MEPHMPRMALLIQAAGNAAQNISKGEHQLQLCRKTYNAWYEEALSKVEKSQSLADNFGSLK
eukprot:5161760-Karenia_brevis.AAC.1